MYYGKADSFSLAYQSKQIDNRSFFLPQIVVLENLKRYGAIWYFSSQQTVRRLNYGMNPDHKAASLTRTKRLRSND